MHGAVIAAERRIQVDEELDVEASHLPLQDVGDGLPLVLLVLPLPPGDVGTPEEDMKQKDPQSCDCVCLLLTISHPHWPQNSVLDMKEGVLQRN